MKKVLLIVAVMIGLYLSSTRVMATDVYFDDGDTHDIDYDFNRISHLTCIKLFLLLFLI